MLPAGAVGIVLHEEVLVQAVARESDHRNAKPWYRVLEPVPPRELACVPPRFAATGGVYVRHYPSGEK
jgi:hypothetical protein